MPYNNARYSKNNKFRAQKTTFMGIKFDSKWESERYAELNLLLRAGEIENLETQVRFDLIVNDSKICTYVADFTYYEKNKEGEKVFIVEDAKGLETAVFKLKKKLMLAIKGIDIRVTKKK